MKLKWKILMGTGLVFLIVLAVWSRKTATTVMVGAEDNRRAHTIVIDAGHGGVDGGATSCTGVLESELNLQIALKLEDLMHLLGYKTIMIRRTDISVYTKGATIAQKKVSDLKERVRIVNSIDNALLISIHQNTFSDGKYSGAQVFYGGYGESQALAQIMQTAFAGTINPGSNRKSKAPKGVYLMEHVNRTAVLVECGFLSNAAEEAKLRDPEYQKKVCCVIVCAVSKFLDG